MELESHLLHLSVPKAVAYLIDLPDRTHLPTSKSCFSQWYHYEDTVNIPRKPKGNNTYIWQVIQNKDGENKIIQTGESEFQRPPEELSYVEGDGRFPRSYGSQRSLS